MTLANSVVLITGASNGIGKATALAFAREGAIIIVTYYNDRKNANETEKLCKGNGAKDVFVQPLNVMDEASQAACVRNVLKRFGRIEVLVNNAGVAVWKPLAKQSSAEVKEQVRTNLEGLITMTKTALPYVRKVIINIASGAGITAYAGLSTYCATKFGVRGFTQALSQELDQVKVYSVNPGMTATRMTNFRGVPANRVADVIVNTAKGVDNLPSGSDVNVWELI